MNFKAMCMVSIMAILVFSIIDARMIVKRSPTCPEPTCGGTRNVGGEGGEEEGEKDPNCDDGSEWNNFYAWYQHCKDGSVGAYKDPPGRGKIGTPMAEGETY